jgi:hypothetical protein
LMITGIVTNDMPKEIAIDIRISFI